MNGLVDVEELKSFLQSKGLIKEGLFVGPSPQEPPSLDIESFLKNWLKQKGFEIIGELPAERPTPPKPPTDPMMGWRPLPVTHPKALPVGAFAPEPAGPEIPTLEERPREIIERPTDYVPPPGFWQQIKDVAKGVMTGKIDPGGIVTRGLLRGITFGNIDPVALVEKISGKEGLAEDVHRLEKEYLKEEVGYVPEKALRAVEIPAEITGALVPLSKILKGAGVAARAVTDVPVLQALARAEITGIATGLARKPREEGILNRVKQIPGDVLFFTLFDLGLLTAEQALKIYRWNRAWGKYKGQKWGSWEDIPDIPGGTRLSPEEVKNLFRKMQGNSTSMAENWQPLTAQELEFIETLKSTHNGWRQAMKEGWFHPGEAKVPFATFAEVGPIPSRPRFTDIFRRKIPRFEPPGPRRPFPREEPPLAEEAAPPRPEAPPRRPEGAARPTAAASAVVVDVEPNPAGGWTYNFRIPTEAPAPAAPVRSRRITAGQIRGLLPERVVDQIDQKAEEILDVVLPKEKPRVFRPSKWPLINWLRKRPIDIESIKRMNMLGEFEEVLELQRAGKIPRIIVGPKSRANKQELFIAIENAQQKGFVDEPELDPFVEALRGEVRGRRAIPREGFPEYEATLEREFDEMMMDYYETLGREWEEHLAQFEPGEVEAIEESAYWDDIIAEAERDIDKGIAALEAEIKAGRTIDPENLEDVFFSGFDEYPAWKRKAEELSSRIRGNEENVELIEKLSQEAHGAGIPNGMLPRELTQEYFDELETKLRTRKTEITEEEIERAIKPREKFELRREAEKERWQMTRAEYEAIKSADEPSHREMIDSALREGKHVPDEVLAEYPDLKKMIQQELIERPEIARRPAPPVAVIPQGRPPEFGKIERQLGIDYEPTEKLPFEERKPAAFSDEEIRDILNKYKVPPEFQGDLYMALTRYDPKKGPVENYVRKTLANLFKRSKLMARKEAATKKPLEEAEVPATKQRGPFEKFARAEEESRVLDVFRRVSKNDREFDLLKRRILDEDSYDEIGKTYGISAQAVEKAFKKALEKVKKDPEVVSLIRRKMKYMRSGPVLSHEEATEFVRWVNEWFTSRRGVVEHIDAANDQRIGKRLAEQFEVSLDAKDLSKFIRKNRTQGLESFILDILKGEVDVNTTALPDEIKGLLSRMRERIDKLSQLIIAEGALSDKMEEIIERNLGRYLRRKFRLYEQQPRVVFGMKLKRWNPAEPVRNRFKEYLRSTYPSTFGRFTEEEMDSYLNAILKKRDYLYRRSAKRTKRIPTDLFKRRKDLPKEFREFAGEIEDPVWLYLRTTTDQAQAAYNAEFLNLVAKEFPDLWTADATVAAQKGWHETQLPKEYGYGKLRGKYVHPELYDYVKNDFKHEVGSMERAILKLIMNPFKATKTLGSIPTHARNTLGNIMFSILLRNSILNPANAPYYFEGLDIILKRNSTRKADWSDLIKRGVTETQFYGAEIPKFYSDLMKLDPPDWPDKIYNWLIKKPVNFAGTVYNFEDVIYRVAADIKNLKHFNMDPEESVIEINRGMTNYRKLPVVVDIMRRWTFLGPFISFKANVAKIITAQASQAVKEMYGAAAGKPPKGPRGEKRRAEEYGPEERAKDFWKGFKRLMRLGFVLGLPTAIAKLSREIFDFDEKDLKDLELAMPDYRRNGLFFYFPWKGRLKAFDFTYFWPTGEIERGIRSLARGDIDSFTEALQVFAHPIFDVYSIMIRGKDPYWDTSLSLTGNFWKDYYNRLAKVAQTIWLPASAPLPSLKALLKGEIRPGALTGYQLKAIINAYNQEPDRYGRVKSLPEELKNFFTGLRTWNVEPDKLVLQSIRAEKAKIFEATDNYKAWLRQNPKAPAWEKKEHKDDFLRYVNQVKEKILNLRDLYNRMAKEDWSFQRD